MIVEPNYQPEDIVEDGLELSSQEMSRALLNDLLEALEYWDKHPGCAESIHEMKAQERLTDCFMAYRQHQETLEEI